MPSRLFLRVKSSSQKYIPLNLYFNRFPNEQITFRQCFRHLLPSFPWRYNRLSVVASFNKTGPSLLRLAIWHQLDIPRELMSYSTWSFQRVGGVLLLQDPPDGLVSKTLHAGACPSIRRTRPSQRSRWILTHLACSTSSAHTAHGSSFFDTLHLHK